MRMKVFLCMGLLAASCLCGCGQKEKVSLSETYDTEIISSIHMQVDSWQLNIMASADDDVHVSLDGGIAKGAKAPSVDIQDGVLDIVQTEGEETIGSQFSLGKEGEVTVYVPDTLEGTVIIKNGSGDMEIDSLVASKLTLDNSSGYIEMNNVTADVLEITSSSGDVKLSGSKIDNFQISTSSGYVTWKNTKSDHISITAKSGEVNVSGLGEQTNAEVSTGSGDIGISYGAQPQNLSFKISSGSDDVSVGFDAASYTTETSACKQGKIGDGTYSLTVNSDSGTVVVHE